MKVLFQNETSEMVYIGWTNDDNYQHVERPNVLLLQPYREVIIETTNRYYLSVRINDNYVFDAKSSIASKIVIVEDSSPYLMFHYNFDVHKYERSHGQLPYGYPIHTWRAHYLQGDMMNKLELL
jgi:hypothetical protein